MKQLLNVDWGLVGNYFISICYFPKNQNNGNCIKYIEIIKISLELFNSKNKK